MKLNLLADVKGKLCRKAGLAEAAREVTVTHSVTRALPCRTLRCGCVMNPVGAASAPTVLFLVLVSIQQPLEM